MRRSAKILEQYLEGIKWEAMEKYPDVIKAQIRGKSGVYALYHEKQGLYYVGLASNLMGRLKTHLKDRHKGLWNRFSVYLTAQSEQSHIRELEALLLRIVRPSGNRVSGRLGNATNLYRALHDAMAERDSEQRASLLGGVAKRRLDRKQQTARKRAGKNPRGKRIKEKPAYPAANIASPRLKLEGTYKGKTHHAVLRRDGQIRYKEKLYPTPTSVALLATGRRSMNGWWFWKVKREGEWVRLKELRKY
jgi:hypothetical protein